MHKPVNYILNLMKCKFWTGVWFSLLVADVSGLQCFSCHGNSDCQETEICKKHQQQCSTTVMTIVARPKISTYFLKGCGVGGKPNNSISHLSSDKVVFLAEEHCETELCNRGLPKGVPNVVEMLRIRGHNEKVLSCYSCTMADQTCYNSSLLQMRCAWPGEKCVDITSFSNPDEFPQDQERIKGCGKLSHCQEPLGFHNHRSFYLIKCCNSSWCNNDEQDYKAVPLPLNGVTCHSCEGNATHGCTEDNSSQVQCRGPMTNCLEASGIHGTSGQRSVFKGCASPSWCESSYTSVYKNLGTLETRCCSSELCNSLINSEQPRSSPRSQGSPQATAGLSTGLLLFAVFLFSESS